eukprot:scaffold74826_cov40-Tisochrysis_lutea.AAC.3
MITAAVETTATAVAMSTYRSRKSERASQALRETSVERGMSDGRAPMAPWVGRVGGKNQHQRASVNSNIVCRVESAPTAHVQIAMRVVGGQAKVIRLRNGIHRRG